MNRCNVRKQIYKTYREKYGLFWRFKRNRIQLDNIESTLKDIKIRLDKEI